MARNEILVDEKVREFLLEDIGFGDITTDSIISEDLQTEATVFCNEDAVIAGLEEASKVFTILGCRVKLLKKDGASAEAGTPVMQISGSGKAILKGERTALNILMRMSGIATATQKVLAEARKVNSGVRVACTRKTAPGLRYFDKKAVELGGGDTHRLRLDDCVLIKNNHLKLVGSVKEAVKRAKERVSFTKKVEVEVETLNQAMEAAEAGADIVMLDNMRPEEILLILKELERKKLREKVLIEASGGITEENIKEYAMTGVDILSLGALTHSVRAIDMNLRVIE
ncbi:MAG: carboxylating nicotinate-nucleotide diphosphorylase [Candidatus Bathyarchaeia archaeon]